MKHKTRKHYDATQNATQHKLQTETKKRRTRNATQTAKHGRLHDAKHGTQNTERKTRNAVRKATQTGTKTQLKRNTAQNATRRNSLQHTENTTERTSTQVKSILFAQRPEGSQEGPLRRPARVPPLSSARAWLESGRRPLFWFYLSRISPDESSFVLTNNSSGLDRLGGKDFGWKKPVFRIGFWRAARVQEISGLRQGLGPFNHVAAVTVAPPFIIGTTQAIDDSAF